MFSFSSIPALPDAQHLALIGGIAVGLVVAWVQIIKPFLERRVPPTDSLHDPALRVLAVVLAVGFILLGVYAPGVFNVIAIATGIAIGSYGGFHLISTPTPADSGVPSVANQEPLSGVQPMQPIADPNGIQIDHATFEDSGMPVAAHAATPAPMVSTITPPPSPVAASPVETGSTADSAV